MRNQKKARKIKWEGWSRTMCFVRCVLNVDSNITVHHPWFHTIYLDWWCYSRDNMQHTHSFKSVPKHALTSLTFGEMHGSFSRKCIHGQCLFFTPGGVHLRLRRSEQPCRPPGAGKGLQCKRSTAPGCKSHLRRTGSVRTRRHNTQLR